MFQDGCAHTDLKTSKSSAVKPSGRGSNLTVSDTMGISMGILPDNAGQDRSSCQTCWPRMSQGWVGF